MREGDRTPLSPAQRASIGRKGGLTTAARGHVNTTAAREARKRRFYDQVDPEGVLPPDEREKRARAAEAAYMADLQYKATKAKKAKKAERRRQNPDG